ncbi:DUF3102 domain-containing protein [Bacillus infantis]|uniref:DUF3102 domain-containing protein n=1 Tax=Bacillus infantis TaxID=324767 RepID=UPI0020A05523|nr:DUF3102 domain-containing protein [Bacillus infantis]MCP1159410.1 DUF3102 domain-containing protein [Bacillus infantis]
MSTEIALSNDLNVITAEINSYKQVAGQAIFEIGRRLKHVKEKDLVHGEWMKWLETVDMTQQHATRFIRVYNRFGNQSPGSDLNLQPNVTILSLLVQFDDEELDKIRELPDGSFKKLTEMSRREIEDFRLREKKILEEKEKALMAASVAERRAKEAERALEEEKNKPSKVETKYIEKEIDNTDYDSILKLNKQIEQKQNSYEQVIKEKQKLENKLRSIEEENQEYLNLKSKIERLHREKEDIHRQIESATSISALYVDIEDLLKNKLAPIKYSRALTERRDSEVAMKNLREIIQMVDEWSFEMKKYLPNGKNKYIDAEVIEYE